MLFWGVADFLGAKAVRRVGLILTLFGIQAAGLASFLLPVWWAGELEPWPGWAAVAAALCFSAGYAAFYRGLQRGAIGLVSPISSAWPLITLGIAALFLGQSLEWIHALAAATIAGGLMITLYTPASGGRPGVIDGLWTMVLWGIASALLIIPVRAIGWLSAAAWIRLMVTALTAAALGIQSGRDRQLPRLSGAGWLLLVTGVLDAAANIFYAIGIYGQPAYRVAPVAAGYPIVTVLLSRYALGERLRLRERVGTAIVIAGGILLGSAG